MVGTKPEEFLSAHEAETSEELVKSGMDFSDYVNNKSSGKYVADADTASESSVPFLAECENTNFSHFASVSKMINVTQVNQNMMWRFMSPNEMRFIAVCGNSGDRIDRAKAQYALLQNLLHRPQLDGFLGFSSSVFALPEYLYSPW